MAIYAKEFYRERLPHDNHVAWSLRFDSETGELRVHEARTSQSSYLRDKLLSPGEFLKTGNSKEQRVFKQELAKLVKSFGMEEQNRL